jgi:hypothetical protein
LKHKDLEKRDDLVCFQYLVNFLFFLFLLLVCWFAGLLFCYFFCFLQISKASTLLLCVRVRFTYAEDHIYDLPSWFGGGDMPDFREPGFLEDSRVPDAVKQSVGRVVVDRNGGAVVQVEFSWTHSLKAPGFNP